MEKSTIFYEAMYNFNHYHVLYFMHFFVRMSIYVYIVKPFELKQVKGSIKNHKQITKIMKSPDQ